MIVTNLNSFRNEIIVYVIVRAALAEAVSLFLIGPDVMFSLGLAAGTAVSIIGFVILI